MIPMDINVPGFNVIAITTIVLLAICFVIYIIFKKSKRS
jgi:hypothetical protein